MKVRLLSLLSVWCVCGLPSSAWAYEQPSWLFTVDVPVADQTVASRDEATQEGLLSILQRVTGLSSIPRNEQVVTALEGASSHATEYAFLEHLDAEGRPELHLRVAFGRDRVLKLVKDARLPLWWTQRPKILLLLVIEENGVRSLLDAGSEHPLVAALQAHARERGLDLVLPVMDLNDQITASAGDVWGRTGSALDGMRERYTADLVLAGRLTATLSARRGLRMQGNWEMWFEERPQTWDVQGSEFTEVAQASLQEVVTLLVEAHGVLARELRAERFNVSGLYAVQDYARLVNYLESLDFFEDVQIVGMRGPVAEIAVATTATREQLLRLLTAQNWLAEDHLHRGLEMQLVWND